jgi:hypothetical protein
MGALGSDAVLTTSAVLFASKVDNRKQYVGVVLNPTMATTQGQSVIQDI